jgi:DNA ligase D-like protein (predicted 3'-phosphoesterase)
MRSVVIIILFCTFVGENMAKATSLKKYREKRSFAQTPEPRGKKIKTKKGPIFVIQKHAASHLHYDVRLEIDGVLTSWAVPKGPSLNPAQKRLAVRTEDHPLEYATFEGVIPEGNYGAGTVMVWDTGTYKNIKKEDGTLVPMRECLERGTVEVWLDGKKLRGGYALIRTKGIYAKGGWLLIKMDDEYASARRNPVSTLNKSVLTNRTMTQIRKEA